MRIAFYAPMKAPDHPTPSGDRRMARMLLRLLQDLGHEPVIASRFRSFDGTGSEVLQRRLEQEGEVEAHEVLRRLWSAPPDLWLTYHVYHKAPDWLGPRISRALDLPYVVVEASVAGKQATGAWRLGYLASVAQIAAADVVLAITERDAAGLAPVVGSPALRRLPPFLDVAPFREAASARSAHRVALAEQLGLDLGKPWLLTVGMMREDVKLTSYRLLAEALRRLREVPWQLVVVGDGPARAEVEAAFAGLPAVFAGSCEETELPAFYAAADLYVWPACAEAYGMAMLEAAAAGLPVVAGREGGVPDIVVDGVTGLLVEPRQPQAMAEAIAGLLGNPVLRKDLGVAAAEHAGTRHGLDAARRTMADALDLAVKVHLARRKVGACASA